MCPSAMGTRTGDTAGMPAEREKGDELRQPRRAGRAGK